jgi:hypothetical protein
MVTPPTPWHYDSRLLVPRWDHFHRRIGYHHPNPPEIRALAGPDVFMGWTMAEARACCADCNANLRHNA